MPAHPAAEDPRMVHRLDPQVEDHLEDRREEDHPADPRTEGHQTRERLENRQVLWFPAAAAQRGREL